VARSPERQLREIEEDAEILSELEGNGDGESLTDEELEEELQLLDEEELALS